MTERGERGGRRRLIRRLRTVPTVLALCAVFTVASPVLIGGALLVDVVRRVVWGVPFVAVRMVLFGWWYLLLETLALAVLLVTWPLSGFGRWRRVELAVTYRLQEWWAGVLFAGVVRIFGMSVEVEGDEVVMPGPMLLFIRHASIADTLIANVIATRRHGLLLRYVLKSELLVDPTIDIGAHRLVNCFVDRRAGDSAAEIARVRRLAENLTESEGVLIYPEGTRYTPEKAAKIRASVARKAPELSERTNALRHVLPPKLGGPLALLEGAPDADVVFCSHVGLDGLANVSHIWSGDMVRATLRVSFRRVPRTEIPEDRTGRIDWLFAQWAEVDRWIDRALSDS
jgi:1-acyl-sn-glycerol-3-phosphate acyltransferase